MRIRTNALGEAFTMNVDFLTPIATIPGTKYLLSMYTLVNCPLLGCETASDKISVQIKEGFNSEFKEVYVVKGRVRDSQWIQEKLKFIASQDRVFVSFFVFDKIESLIFEIFFFYLFQNIKIRLVFSRSISQGSAGVGSFYVDQIQLMEFDSKFKIKFVSIKLNYTSL